MYSWISLSSGAGHTLAVRTDNTLWAWGSNTAGQLGDGTTINKSSPTQVGTSSWSKVFAGISFTAAIDTAGKLYVWGANTNGSLGLGDTINRSSPTQLGTSSWTTAALGGDASGFMLAVQSNGSLWTWGINTYGQLGDGSSTARSSPVQVGTSSWVSVAAGPAHSAAITTLGALWMCGTGGSGELAQGNTTGYPTLVKVADPMSWTMVALGGTVYSSYPNSFSLAIRSDGLLFSWGQNFLGGSLGLNDTSNRSQATYVSSGSYSWSQISASGMTVFGISSDNKQLWGWGRNDSGQLGYTNATSVSRSSPTLIDSGGSFTLIDTGALETTWPPSNASVFYVKTVNNTPALYGMGDAVVGHLGDGTTVNKSSPVPVGTNVMLSNKLTPTDSIISAFNVFESSPVQVGSSSWNIIKAGDQHTLGLTSANTLFAWGNNRFGQLGDSTTINKSSPVQIGSGTYVDASAGFNNNAVEKSDGTVYTFGSNDFGKLGDNT